jgi:hypothetical protein
MKRRWYKALAPVVALTWFLAFKLYHLRSELLSFVPAISGTLVLYFGYRNEKKRALLRMRALNDLCRKCGYDLRAIPDKCPDCGALVNPSVRKYVDQWFKGTDK